MYNMCPDAFVCFFECVNFLINDVLDEPLTLNTVRCATVGSMWWQ